MLVWHFNLYGEENTYKGPSNLPKPEKYSVVDFLQGVFEVLEKWRLKIGMNWASMFLFGKNLIY